MLDNSNQGEKILKQTRGVCPECLSELEATIVKINNQIIIRRKCFARGKMDTVISNNPKEYEELFYYYNELDIIKGQKRIKKRCTIFYTNRCNIDCPICFMNANFKGNIPDPSNKSLKPLLRNKKGAKINIFGGNRRSGKICLS